MPRSVICVSHESGAGGQELAIGVAERLGYRIVDEEVVAHAANREQVTVEQLADVERRKSFFTRAMTDFGTSGAAWFGAGSVPPELLSIPTPRQLRAAIRTAIEDIAGGGEVVIVSHAASHALVGDHVLRVLVVAPAAVRASRLAEGGLSGKSLDKAVADEDAGRRAYLKDFYGIDHETAHDYDLVVNTGSIAPAAFVDVVVAAAGI